MSKRMSVIIPAHNEEKYLNWTIDNIFRTCVEEPEVIVVLNGYDQEVDPRAFVLRNEKNLGERKAMNSAAHKATGDFLFRIDAHCDFGPLGWDRMLMDVTEEFDITVGVLTATDPETRQHLPGHWYGLCRLIVNEHGGLEAKWQTPNKTLEYKTVEPNMAFTGCGWMIRKDFYWDIGGADTYLAPMGAIGEEFAIKAWYNGGRVQTRTDVKIGHIFGTGGYDTSKVAWTQDELNRRYGSIYNDVVAKFPHWDVQKVRSTKQLHETRTVTVERTDVTDSKDTNTGKILRRRRDIYRYVWVSTEHPGEEHWTDDEIRQKYQELGELVETKVQYAKEGELID